MGCGANSQPNTNSPKPVTHTEEKPSEQKPNDALIWLKVNEPMTCSKCGGNSQTFFSSSKEKKYLCTSCCPIQTSSDQCPNFHPLIWSRTSQQEVCNVCSQPDTSFYTCAQCNYRVCTTHCKPRFATATAKSSSQCPNGHNLTWRKNAFSTKCQTCGTQGGAGYLCEEDKYFVCSKECKKIKAVHLCPNGHMLEWHKLIHAKKCEICGRKDDQIYECKACQFTLCHICKENKESQIKMNKEKLNISLGTANAGHAKKAVAIATKAASKTPNRRPEGGRDLTPLRIYQDKSKALRSKTDNRSLQSQKESPTKKNNNNTSNKSRMNLQQMSNLVENLLEQNATMQASLANVINRSQSVDKMRDIGKLHMRTDNSGIAIEKV